MIKILDWLVENIMPTFAVIGIGFIALFLIFLPFMIVADGKERNRLMSQCLADGRAEYECYSMLRNNRSHGYVARPVK